MEIYTDSVACHLTAKCNLRCKKCSVFIPKLYKIGNVPEYDINDIKSSFKTYFEMVDSVRYIFITGGEPMLYPHLSELIKFLLQYENKFERLDVFTNGTLQIKEDVLAAIAKSKKMGLFVDDYGPEVSTKVDIIKQSCEKYGVNYYIRKYHGKDMHLGGWVDRSILPEKLDDETARYHFSKCFSAQRGKGRLFTIFGRLLTFCASPYCGYRIGAIPEKDVLSIDLCDENMTMEEKRKKLVEMDNIDFNPGCAWCNGLGVYENVERFIPAEQEKE